MPGINTGIGSRVNQDLGVPYWTKPFSEFLLDRFDFTTNQLKDKSGNGNHAIMVGASARIGNEPIAANTLLTGLIHYYKFNEITGDCVDSVGTLHGSVLNNTVRGVAGKAGLAYSFPNEAFTGVSLTGTEIFQTTDSFTIAAWVKVSALAAGTRYAVAFSSTSGKSVINIYLINNDLTFQIRGENNAGLTSVPFNDSITTEWCLIIAERNVSTDKINLTVNNVSAGAGVTDATTAAIGTLTGFAVSFNWDGLIDDLGIWRKILTEDEKTALYNSGKGLTHPFEDNQPLDYYISGLLTTDTVTVETGSDMPTIPCPNILRISEGQTVYGVTITRAGTVWAMIPFCEPVVCAENFDKNSYDVSGNGHHANADGLLAAHITTQNNYFYLQRYGYTIGGNNIITSKWNWAADQWTGAYPNQTFTGLDSINTGILEPASGNRLKMTTPYQMRELLAQTLGKRYLTKVVVDSYTQLTGASGIQLTNNGVKSTNLNNIKSVGTHIADQLATSTTFEISYESGTFEIIVSEISLREKILIPALLSQLTDALGNTLEYIANGIKWLEWGCDLIFPDSVLLKAADQKGYWSDLIDGGGLINTKTYLIETTETDYFGSGKVVHDEFVSDGTELATKNNTVRELLPIGGERGFLYTDLGVANTMSYSDFTQRMPHFIYTHKPYFIDPNRLRWNYNYIDNLIVFKSDKYITQEENIRLIGEFFTQEDIQTTPILITFDHLPDANRDRLNALFTARGINKTFYINYGGTMSHVNIAGNAALGDEVALHTAYNIGVGELPEYKGGLETSANYNESELRAFYAAEILFYQQQLGITMLNHAYPSGAHEDFTLSVASEFFTSGRLASGSGSISKIPIQDYLHMPAYSMDAVETTLATIEGYVDTAIADKSLLFLYGHAVYWDVEARWTAFEALLDYIISKQVAGNQVRIYTVQRAIDIIQRKL